MNSLLAMVCKDSEQFKRYLFVDTESRECHSKQTLQKKVLQYVLG